MTQEDMAEYIKRIEKFKEMEKQEAEKLRVKLGRSRRMGRHRPSRARTFRRR